MKLSVNPQLFVDFDNPRIAVSSVRGANNRADMHSFLPLMESLVEKVQQSVGPQPVSQLPKIAAWREAYRTFGVKAKDYPSSIESLYKRSAKGEVTSISPLVDIYNYISIKYILPAGGEDIDKIVGNLELTYASDQELAITVLGRNEAQAPAPGEVIYKDNEGTICRRWNWREAARTMLTDDTQNCILVLEALNPTTDKELLAAQDELGKLVQAYTQGTVHHFLLNADNPVINF